MHNSRYDSRTPVHRGFFMYIKITERIGLGYLKKVYFTTFGNDLINFERKRKK